MNGLAKYNNTDIEHRLAKEIQRAFEVISDSLNREEFKLNPGDWHYSVNKKDKGFCCIHYHYEDFFKLMNIVINDINKSIKTYYKNFTFLDVGCGVGHKMALARILGFNPHGIELRKYLIEKAKNEWFAFNADQLYHQDAFDFDKYNKFDVIYLYRPIENWDLMSKLIDIIVKKAKSGAYFVNFYGSGCDFSDFPHNAKLVKKIKDNVWQKI